MVRNYDVPFAYYWFQIYDFSFENITVARKLFLCFEDMFFLFGNMKVSKKVNHLLRKYDLPIHEYAKVTPTLNERTFVECFGRKPYKNSFPKGAP